MSADGEPWAGHQNTRRHGGAGPNEPHVEIYGALFLVALDNGRIVIGTLNAAAMKAFRHEATR